VERLGQREGIPGAGTRRPGEVAHHRSGAGRAENRGGGVTRQWIERGADAQGHGTDEECAPDVGGVLEDVEPLSATGGPGIPPDGRHRRGIIEALASGVVVDDRDDGRLHREASHRHTHHEHGREHKEKPGALGAHPHPFLPSGDAAYLG
jgi:hypothetical protein